jgi:hypothetical protein
MPSRVIDTTPWRAAPVTDPQTDSRPDLIEQIPEPDTVRGWLAESIRRSELLRSLLRVAIRKAAYRRLASADRQEVRRGS